MNYILQTNSLTKKYKNFQALNGLTMNVPKGFHLWALWERTALVRQP